MEYGDGPAARRDTRSTQARPASSIVEPSRARGFTKGGHAVGHAQEILEDHDLAMAGRAGADADERDARGLEDADGDLVRHGLDQEHLATGLLEGDCVGDDRVSAIAGAARGGVAAGDRDALGFAAHVAADGDAGADHALDEPGKGCVSFELDDVGKALADEATGVAHGVIGRGLVGHEGHVAHDQSFGGPTFDPGGEREQDAQVDVDSAGVAEDDLGGGVAHEQDVDAGTLQPAGGGGVVAGDAGEGPAIAGHARDAGEGQASRRSGSFVAGRGQAMRVSVQCEGGVEVGAPAN